ncbi:calcium-binding protein [Fusibacter sp. 3D3]|uniref:calcium-binding protein n=1 Tax=Fusibacter sp. 3D3 TaxID=1048380 RepID=UPI0008533A0E|nr:calcium-binding protein [Fusibacter sp. 3D3]GAU75501.1 alkaline phosphatase [Fusibacter sp. 3D3]
MSVKLGKLEDALNEINLELKNNPNNINTYDSQSISIIVYEEGYTDLDARNKDYKESGLFIEAYRDAKFALYEEKVRDSDNALVQALKNTYGHSSEDAMLTIKEMMQDIVDPIMRNTSYTDKEKANQIKMAYENKIAVDTITDFYNDYYKEYKTAQIDFDATTGKLVGIYKNNGESHSVVSDGDKVPENLIGFAYVPQNEIDFPIDILESAKTALLAGGLSGIAERLHGMPFKGLSKEMRNLVKSSAQSCLGIYDKIAGNLVDTTTGGTGIVLNFEADKHMLNENIKNLYGEALLNGATEDEKNAMNMLKAAVGLLTIAFPPSIPASMAIAGGMDFFCRLVVAQTSKQIANIELDKYKLLTKDKEINIFVDRIEKIEGTLDYNMNNVIADSYTQNIIKGNNADNRITARGGSKNELYGLDGNDTLTGSDRGSSSGNDSTKIYYDGDDTLDGGLGNDQLYGGSGEDTLIGGLGNDTYIYKSGDGNDTIIEENYPRDTILGLVNNDVVNLNDINAEDILLLKSGADLLLKFIGKPDDSLRISKYFRGMSENGKGNEIYKQNSVEKIIVGNKEYDVRRGLEKILPDVDSFGYYSKETLVNDAIYSSDGYEALYLEGLNRSDVRQFREIDQNGNSTNSLVIAMMNQNKIGKIVIKDYFDDKVVNNIKRIIFKDSVINLKDTPVRYLQRINVTEKVDVGRDRGTAVIISKGTNTETVDDAIRRAFESGSGKEDMPVEGGSMMMSQPVYNQTVKMSAGPISKQEDTILMRDYDLTQIKTQQSGVNLIIRAHDGDGIWYDKVTIEGYFESDDNKVERISLMSSDQTAGGDYLISDLLLGNQGVKPVVDSENLKYYIIEENGMKRLLDYPSVHVKINGRNFDALYNAYNKNGNTMVSVKEFVNTMGEGANITWNTAEKRAYITWNGKTSWIDYNDHKKGTGIKDASIHGNLITMPVEPEIIEIANKSDNTMMASLKVLAQIFNLNVSWDAINNTALLETASSYDSGSGSINNSNEVVEIGNANNVIIDFNGAKFDMQKDAYIKPETNRAMVCAKEFMDIFNSKSQIKLSYSMPNRNTIIITYPNGKTSTAVVGNSTYTLKSVLSNSLETAPELKNGEMMVPLKFFTDALDANLSWNASTYTASFKSDYYNLGEVFASDQNVPVINAPTVYYGAKTGTVGNPVIIKNGNTIVDNSKTDIVYGRARVQINDLLRYMGNGTVAWNDTSNIGVFGLPNGKRLEYCADFTNQRVSWYQILESNGKVAQVSTSVAEDEIDVKRFSFFKSFNNVVSNVRERYFDRYGVEANTKWHVESNFNFPGYSGSILPSEISFKDIEGYEGILRKGSYSNESSTPMEYWPGTNIRKYQKTTWTIGYSGSLQKDESKTYIGAQFAADIFGYALRWYSDGQQVEFLSRNGSDRNSIVLNLNNYNSIGVGESGDDIIFGSSQNDRIAGRDGNDFLYGNNGKDIIIGEAGRDTIFGGTDDDMIYGGSENDLLYGDSGNDQLYGGSGNDMLTGGDGIDYLYGNEGNDTFDGGNGSDVIYGDSGDDVLQGGFDNDILHGGSENDTLFGGSGNDSLYGENGADQLYGGSGNDVLDGGSGNNNLYGDDGDDSIYGGDSNDLLNGGTGSDYLSGGQGSDVYEFNTNFGRDTVADVNGNSQFKFNNHTSDAFNFIREINNDDLQIKLKNSQDMITIKDYFKASIEPGYMQFQNNVIFNRQQVSSMVLRTGSDSFDRVSLKVNETEFKAYGGNDTVIASNRATQIYGGSGQDTLIGGSDSDVLYGETSDDVLRGNSGNDRLYGGSGNDYLYGGLGEDTLVGDSGDNYLEGNQGSDLYVIGSENSNSIIVEDGTSLAEKDIVKIDFLYEDATISRDNFDLIISHRNLESVTCIRDYFSNKNTIEEINFLKSNGQYEILKKENFENIINFGGGTDRSEMLVGTSEDDLITGFGGNDTLYGGNGNDVYVFGSDFGQNSVIDNDHNNTIWFKDNLSSDFTFEKMHNNGDLYIKQKNTPNQVFIKDYFKTSGTIGSIIFRNQENFGLQQILDKIMIYGTGSADTIFGTENVDRIYAGNGNDIIHASKGDDYLVGGAGADTYKFVGDFGKDTIIDFNINQEMDVIELIDISSEDLEVTRENGSIIMKQLKTANQIILKDFLNNGNLDSVVFKNGATVVETWGKDVLLRKSISKILKGDAFNNQLTGSSDLSIVDEIHGKGGNDVVHGLQGNDYLYGDEGDDYLYGDEGDDQLYGGTGNDYIESGAGDDKIYGEGGGGYFDGGSGNDYIECGDGENEIHGGDGDDQIYGGNDYDEITAGAGNDIIYGGADYDEIDGGDGRDQLYGGSGNDHLYGGNDRDGLYGGFGDDHLYGGSNDDILFGEEGSDELHGDSGDDELCGEAGNDVLYGNSGEDILRGGAGDDLLYGGEDNDTLAGEWGNDTLHAGDGNDRLAGGIGDDYLYGGFGDDVLYGESGNDHLFGESGNDILEGGTGADRYYFQDGFGKDIISDNNVDLTDSSRTSDAIIIAQRDLNEVSLVREKKYGQLSKVASSEINVVANTFRVSALNTKSALSGGHPDNCLYISANDGNSVVSSSGYDPLVDTEINKWTVETSDGDVEVVQSISSSEVMTRGHAKIAMVYDTGKFSSKDPSKVQFTLECLDTDAEGKSSFRADLVYGNEVLDSITYKGNRQRDRIIELGADLSALAKKYGNIYYSNLSVNLYAETTSANGVMFKNANAELCFDGLLNEQSNDLIITDNKSNDMITIQSQFNSKSNAIEKLELEHGTFDIASQNYKNGILGKNTNDILYGTRADDVLMGGEGNDTLSGSLGDDVLYGGTGDDRYLFDRKDGRDLIYDVSGNDVAVFNEYMDRIMFRRANSDLIISTFGTGDKVTVSSWFSDSNAKLSEIQLNDGMSINSSNIEKLIEVMSTYSNKNGISWSDAIDHDAASIKYMISSYYSKK